MEGRDQWSGTLRSWSRASGSSLSSSLLCGFEGDWDLITGDKYWAGPAPFRWGIGFEFAEIGKLWISVPIGIVVWWIVEKRVMILPHFEVDNKNLMPWTWTCRRFRFYFFFVGLVLANGRRFGAGGKRKREACVSPDLIGRLRSRDNGFGVYKSLWIKNERRRWKDTVERLKSCCRTQKRCRFMYSYPRFTSEALGSSNDIMSKNFSISNKNRAVVLLFEYFRPI